MRPGDQARAGGDDGLIRHDLDVALVNGLLQERHLAVLATHRKDGGILLSPIWYRWENERIHVGILAGDIKLRHISRNPNVTVVVAEEDPPYRGFEVRGVAHPNDADFPPAMRQIARRYLGPIGDALYRDHPQGSVVDEPIASRSWDFADDMGEAAG